MSYLTHLKRVKMHHSNRWVAKYDSEGLIKEIKLRRNIITNEILKFYPRYM